MKKVVLLAGGGGHTAYAYALAQHLYDRCEMEIIVPEADQLSFNRLKRFGTVKTLLKPRGPKTPLIPFMGRLARSFFRSSRMLRDRTVMVSTGSNFCIPPCILAWKNGNPIINLESSIRFTRASKTAKILSRVAKVTALQWEEQRKFLPKGEVFGPMLAKPEIQAKKGEYILVTGGTYGHKLLFQAVDSSKIDNVLLQAGALYTPEYSKKHPGWKVIDYSTNFHGLIAEAEVVVTHFGETVIDSALVYGKPTVISVNPEWTRTVGLDDAAILAMKVNGVLLNEFNPEALQEAIDKAKRQRPPKLTSGAELLSSHILDIAENMQGKG